MNNNMLYLAAIVSSAIIIAVYVYCQHNRYEIAVSASSATGYRLDKRSGDIWVLRGTKRSEQIPDSKEKEKYDFFVTPDGGVDKQER